MRKRSAWPLPRQPSEAQRRLRHGRRRCSARFFVFRRLAADVVQTDELGHVFSSTQKLKYQGPLLLQHGGGGGGGCHGALLLFLGFFACIFKSGARLFLVRVCCTACGLLVLGLGGRRVDSRRVGRLLLVPSWGGHPQNMYKRGQTLRAGGSPLPQLYIN